MNDHDQLWMKRQKNKQCLQCFAERASAQERLQALHEKVKAPGVATAYITGILGALFLGVGILNVALWEIRSGLILGISGILLALIAYPVYRALMYIRSRKYAAEILALSKECLEDQE